MFDPSKAKLFDKLWVSFGDIKMPAVFWGKDRNTYKGEKFAFVLLCIGGICLPRSYLQSRITCAEGDPTFTWDTTAQIELLKRQPEVTQVIPESLEARS